MNQLFKLFIHHIYTMSQTSVKYITLLFAFLILVSLGSSSSAFATPYNISIDATQVYETQYCIGWPLYTLTHPVDPKIACNEDGSHCVMLVYDDCSFNGVRMFWSTDKFESQIEPMNPGVIPVGMGDFLDYYPLYGQELPYDVEYFDAQSAFYIVAGNDVYVSFTTDFDDEGSLQPIPHVYTPASPYVGGDGNVYGFSMESAINIDCAQNLTSPENWAGNGYVCILNEVYGYKFENEDATNLWGIELCQPYDSSPTDWDGLLCELKIDVTNTTSTEVEYGHLDHTQSCSSGGSFDIDNMTGQAYWTGTDWKHNLVGQVDYCTGTTNVVIDEDTLSSPQENATQVFFGGNLYWRNITNRTENMSGFIFKATTSDFVSYGTPELVYTEDLTINESINQSDADTAGSANIYIWERKSTDDEANNGIWLYREENYRIFVETDMNTPVSVSLYCNETGADYYDSGYGDRFTLNTPCQNNNRLVFSSGNRPSSYIDYIDMPSSCLEDGMYVGIRYAETPYNHTFNVRTETNLPISGADVNFTTGETGTTDVSGQVEIEIQPISGSTLYRNNYSTCEIRYSTDGTGTQKEYLVEKTGYIDYEGFTAKPTKEELDGYYFWSFDDVTDVTMYESGMFLDISLQIGSGVEISPCNYEVNLSGADYIAVMLNDAPNLGSSWDEFPVEFKLNHSSSPVNVTINLTLPNGTSIIEYENLTYDEREEHTFYLPFSLETLICEDDCDCPDSQCIGKYFYDGKTNLCSDGVCQYNVSNCGLEEFCDDLVGCFNADTTDTCTRDSDCSNSCVDGDTMVWGRCGADGLCKNVTYDCAVECNATAGICEELRNCEYGDTFQAKAYIYSGGRQINLLSGSYTCDATSVGERSCLGGGLEDNAIPKSELDFYDKTINDVYISPSGWTYTTSADGLYYNFSDISVYCNDTCGVEYTVCGGNCDQDNGECLDTVGSIENTIKSLMPTWLQFMLTSLFLWTLFALVVGGILTYMPSRISPNAQPTPQFGLAGMFAIYMIGIPLGFVDPFIGLIIVLGIGLYLAKMISSSMAGG